MTSSSFDSFNAASTFAKKIAKENGFSVRITRSSNKYIVEGNFPGNVLSTSIIEPIPVANTDTSSITSSITARLCIDCGTVIPKARVEAAPNVSRCIKCQAAYELTHDTNKRFDEGIGGTREQNIRMRYRGGS